MTAEEAPEMNSGLCLFLSLLRKLSEIKLNKMRRSGLIVVVFFIHVAAAVAQGSIKYTLSMPELHTHYFQVEMVLEGFEEGQLDVKMPVWAPGSYLVREFSKNVDLFKVSTPTGEAVQSAKISKNTWRIEKGNLEKIIVNYNVYAYEISVRTSFLDADHGYVNGTSMFMYVDGRKNLRHRLQIVPYEEWGKVSTALPEAGEGKWTFQAKDYDQLADSPIEIGNHKEITFEAAGVEHKIAMYGEGNYEEEKLKTDLTKIIEGLTGMFGENPNDEYLFIIHNLEKGSGGLEHMNSTTLQVNRWTYAPKGRYQSFLGLAAHEYFHLWLVKRIRPEALGPFDYDQENYTRLLWVMEGFTSYFSQLILVQLGYMSQQEFIEMWAESFTGMENTPGNSVQPVSIASFDAWIKAYRPNENSVNTQISYYQKGSVLAALLDVLIISNSEGKHDLGSVLKYLYENYYKKNGSGITAKDMKNALEQFAQTNLDDFYKKYVHGTEEIDYQKYLGLAGLEIVEVPFSGGDAIKLGVGISGRGGKVIVKSVYRGTPAYKYGINADDEIIAVEGYRVESESDIRNILNNRKPGDTLDILVARDGKTRGISVRLEETEGYYYRIQKEQHPGRAEEETLENWLSL